MSGTGTQDEITQRVSWLWLPTAVLQELLSAEEPLVAGQLYKMVGLLTL